MTTPTRPFRLLFRSLLCGGAFSLLAHPILYAGSATWVGHPSYDYWDDGDNWHPKTFPQYAGDIATFNASGLVSCYISSYQAYNIDSIAFTADAKAYTITSDTSQFNLLGPGIINNSAVMQNFIVVPYGYYDRVENITFLNNSSAGDLAHFTVVGSSKDNGYGGALYFHDQSNAGTALIDNEPSYDLFWGSTNFYETASAGNASIVNQAAMVKEDNYSGNTWFNDDSNAGSATIVNQGASSADGEGGMVYFEDSATAGNSTITCEASKGEPYYPAAAWFHGNSNGGTARIILYGDGTLNIFPTNGVTLLTVGSLEGDGRVLIGPSEPFVFEVGSNNLNATFSGLLEQFNPAGPNASLRKVGTGKLILANANTYAGGTTIESGTLLVNNTAGSGTGSGNVFVAGGTFGGAGTVAGRVLIGIGSGTGATLAPGKSGVKPGTLTIQKRLIMESDATYRVTLDSRTPSADKVTSFGASIRNASILLDDIGTSVIPPGRIFTVINNTAPTPITGTFSNLPDGSTVTVGNNIFQTNYEGGDGNDLTLTAVP